jgi:hypothetical protein
MSNISKISLGGEVYDITLTQEKFNALLKGGSPGLIYNIPEGEAYAICRGLEEGCTETDIVIASEYKGVPVTSIGESAFYYCSSLTSIVIPDSVTSIGGSAFMYCTKLTSIEIPEGVTSIGSQVFYDCSNLTSVVIPDSVKSIGYLAFAGCSSLTSIAIPNSVESIGLAAFERCTRLTSITIPDSVTSIGDEAFWKCSSLTSITIPDSVTSIGDRAFGGCASLTIYCEAKSKPDSWDDNWNPDNRPVVWGAALNIPAVNDKLNKIQIQESTIVGSKGLTYELSEDGTYAICTGLDPEICKETDIVIASIYEGKPVTSIDTGAFAKCTSFTSIEIPDSVESIGEGAFAACTRLTSIEISDGVPSIGDFAFSGCSNLTSVTIPDSVTYIGTGAFDGCTSLTSITIPDSVTTIGLWALRGCTSLTIYCEAVEKPTGWNADWNSNGRPVVWGAALDFLAVNDKLTHLEKNTGSGTLTYTNDTPMAKEHGGIAAGTKFNNVSIQDMLTMILYPYIDITVGTSATVVPTTAKSYDVNDLPTLQTVTLTVKKNSATNLSFELWDTTNNTKVAGPLTEANSDNKLIFSNLNYEIDTTRTFTIKYTYRGEGGVDSGEKTVNVGTFKITFTNPSLNTPTANFQNAAGTTKTAYYAGETATATEFKVSLNSLNSAKKIKKLELYKDNIPTPIAESGDDPNLPYTFTGLSQTLSSASTSKVTTNYKVRAYFDSRTDTSTDVKENDWIESANLGITFTYHAASVSLSGINSQDSISKLSPKTISANKLTATFAKNSSKITSIKLFENGTAVSENNGGLITPSDSFKADGYDATNDTGTFSYSKDPICSNLTLQAKAYNNTTEVAESASINLKFYTPVCYGFVAAGNDLNSINRNVLTTLTQRSSVPSNSTVEMSYPADGPEGGMKILYAVPHGTTGYNFTKVLNQQFAGAECTTSYDIGDREIEFADGTKATYRIGIAKTESSAGVNIKFTN